MRDPKGLGVNRLVGDDDSRLDPRKKSLPHAAIEHGAREHLRRQHTGAGNRSREIAEKISSLPRRQIFVLPRAQRKILQLTAPADLAEQDGVLLPQRLRTG